MKPLKVAIVGYGLSGRFFHGALLSGMAQYQVTHVMTSDPDKTAQAKADFEGVKVVRAYEDILKDQDVDLIVISTPNTTHFSLAAQALQHQKHCLVEKPFTVTREEAELLIALSQKVGKKISVYQNRRYDADFLTLKDLVASGALGELVELESHFDRYRPAFKKDAWREKDLPGSGILYDLGAHLIDQTLHLFGVPDTVYADLSAQKGGLVDDHFEIIMYYPSLKVTLKSGSYVNHDWNRFILFGKKGTYTVKGLDPQEDLLREGQRPHMTTDWGQVPQEKYGRLYLEDQTLVWPSQAGDYRLYYEALYLALKEDQPLPVTPEEALLTMKVIEACLLSNKEARRIKVDV